MPQNKGFPHVIQVKATETLPEHHIILTYIAEDEDRGTIDAKFNVKVSWDVVGVDVPRHLVEDQDVDAMVDFLKQQAVEFLSRRMRTP